MKTSRLEKEANIRKKLEEALKDAQRAIADKEALLQDARNEAAQRENAHIETKQHRDGLLATLTRTQQTLEVEMAAKDELQNLANELKEKFHFQQQLSEKELSEMRCSLDEANKSIELIERRTHEEYDSSEEKISAMLAKIKNRHEMEFQKFKEESEAAYENGVRQIRIQLDDAFLNLETTRDDNVHLKAEAEALNAKVINLGAKDEEIGGFIIRQNVAGRPVSLFRFPPETLLKIQTYTTVWSASSLSNHNPPSEFVNRDHHQWRTGPKCTTILCKPNGQPVSWTKVVCPRDREGKRFSNPPADAAYYSHRSKTSSFDAITERRIWRP
ncbi:unnamed protein product [Porites lobata]|uniref:LTD domain-containing protein n=1 Tax=Porites lobata TaxID=104759 RepID=A0ABN8Q763_9CNID|nr:unnamed protein product [Porites lobata]